MKIQRGRPKRGDRYVYRAGGAPKAGAPCPQEPQAGGGQRAVQKAVQRAKNAAPAARPGKARPVGRVFAVLGVSLAGLLVFLVGASAVLCRGPSPGARDLFVNTCMETSALKFVPRLFLSDGQIESIRARNGVLESGGSTDTDTEFTPPEQDVPLDTIEIEDVSGPSFKGKMMIVHDPSRLRVACLDAFDAEAPGKRLLEFVEQEQAIAGINGGGFVDLNGVGKGGMPLGIVIKDGKLRAGSLGGEYSIIGFDQSDRLIVGTMTGQEAMDRGIRDALSFGPAFIINGEAMDVAGTGGGLNPRTVIGQRADGAVLLLTIDGRQPQSLGASYQDCIQVMLDYGAINAANLDGGSSTQMVYQGETINVCASLYGPRRLPTAIVVK